MIKIKSLESKLVNGSQAELVVFYSTDSSPRSALDQAVQKYAMRKNYQDYTEYIDRKVSDPRIRVVLFGINEIKQFATDNFEF